ncbi:GcvT family protein [Natrinema salifodinae]|uniref:Glycine cleavage system T protein (Aminomethyltransferase) n=1 Tax=Natrinema salifodinae TaxID=1202768 RepID=A0A1I0QG89_9EURY|nr:FAD-dependent oxidoreductase [Natrinema salifodinae]SEW26121.1 Glycine cleavage system T protein (aminomethyltransferase) [Natrinema salifodinae]
MSAGNTLPDSAGTVVVGAGCVGCSAAYHLTSLGREDVVVVDQGPLFETGGSTSHAPGLVFQTGGTKLMTRMASYTRELYEDLDGFRTCGGIEVAYTADRWDFLKRKRERGQSYGIEGGELLSPDEVADRVPQIDPEAIHGGYYVPTDGKAHAVDASAAMAERARSAGAEFYGETTVTDLEVENGEIRAVVTDRGRIAADEVLVATNIWGPLFGDMVGVDIPLVPCAHQYLVSDELPELAGASREIEQPLLRHQDRSLYFRQHGERYGIGSYNHESLLVDPADIYGPEKLDDLGLEYPSLREFTSEHFYENTHPDHDQAASDAACELVPSLRDAEFESGINGMFCFTPDGMPILGPTEEIDGLWWALAIWVTQSGGAGSIVAHWMEDGVPRLDGERVDATGAHISRFQPHAGSREYTWGRGAQQYQEVYQLIHPREQPEGQRGLRRSPFYHRQDELGAAFYDSGGWETPQWYESNEALLEEYDVPDRPDWLDRGWSKAHGVEHQAVRDRVAMVDMTTYTGIEVTGEGATGLLQGLLTNDVDVSPGRIRYAAMCNEDGGILADVTVARLADDQYTVYTGGGNSATLHSRWIREHAPDDGSVSVTTRDSDMCGIGVFGPESREVLSSLVEADLSNDAFPFYTAQETYLESIPVTMLRLSYAGELGWELYAPMEYGARLWELIEDAGEAHGIVPMGWAALDSTSMEKGFRLWGTDVTPEYNPYEAGIGFAVDLETDFVGKEALVEARDAGIDRKLVPITLDEPGAVVDTGHPVLDPDGDDALGYVTRADYGYTIDAGIAYAYLPAADAEPGRDVEISYENDRYAGTVRDEPLFDPDREKMLR